MEPLYADLAHLVERDLAKVEVAGSSPVIRSKEKTTHSGGFFFGAPSELSRAKTRGEPPSFLRTKAAKSEKNALCAFLASKCAPRRIYSWNHALPSHPFGWFFLWSSFGALAPFLSPPLFLDKTLFLLYNISVKQYSNSIALRCKMGFQVFLSFKNTDNGEKTVDSQVAEKLYAYLLGKGVNVFFSNVSLLEFGEAAYKDAIDDALDSVELMVVLGSKAEYLTSQWCKYEWQSYQQNLLSGIVDGTVVTYLGNMELHEVPTAIRHYQSFNMDRDPFDKIGDFIIKALEKKRGAPSQPSEKESEPSHSAITVLENSIFKEKKASAYNPTDKGEKKRLLLQARLTKDADLPALQLIKEKFKDKKKIFILDVGCRNGIVAKDRFADWDNVFVLGIDKTEQIIEKARALNEEENYVYEYVDLDGEDFPDRMEELMEEYDIDAFDLIFGPYVLQHIKDSTKFLRRCRPLLSPNGYVLFRNTADKSTISFGDNGLVKKIQDKTEEAPGNAERDTGIELYHRLFVTGYKNIRVFGYLKELAGLDFDERMEIFKERFSWRNIYFKKALEADPTNVALKNSYEWMSYALDKLEEIFGDESFWYGETIITAIASKK